jgi:hypothetical protein
MEPAWEKERGRKFALTQIREEIRVSRFWCGLTQLHSYAVTLGKIET